MKNMSQEKIEELRDACLDNKEELSEILDEEHLRTLKLLFKLRFELQHIKDKALGIEDIANDFLVEEGR